MIMRLILALSVLLSSCAPSRHAWRVLNEPHKYYVAKPYTRCMWEREAPNAKLFHETCEDNK